jgi:hypothetical protein
LATGGERLRNLTLYANATSLSEADDGFVPIDTDQGLSPRRRVRARARVEMIRFSTTDRISDLMLRRKRLDVGPDVSQAGRILS